MRRLLTHFPDAVVLLGVYTVAVGLALRRLLRPQD